MEEKKTGGKSRIYIGVVAMLLAATAISWSSIDAVTERLKTEDLQPKIENSRPMIEPKIDTVLPDLREETAEPVSEPAREIPQHNAVANNAEHSDSQGEPTVQDSEQTAAGVGLLPVYTMPVEGEISNRFSGEVLVKSLTLGDWRTHNGVDFVAPEGSDVTAVYSGEIAVMREEDLWGKVIEIDLDSGYTARYCGLERFADGLVVGGRVSQGDLLGSVGCTSVIERAEGAHLHFELVGAGGYIDPMSLIQ